MSASVAYNPSAPTFDARRTNAAPSRPSPVRPGPDSRPARPAGADSSSRPDFARPAASEVPRPNKSKAQSTDVMPFVASTALINIGTNTKTMEAARPSVKPFLMDAQFRTLAQETDLGRTLRHRWTMWLVPHIPREKRGAQAEQRGNVVDYLADTQEYATFSTLPAFCEHWNKAYLEGQPPYNKLMVFKKGIKPVWEDPDNRSGGRFVIRCSTMEETLAMFLVLSCRVMTGRVQGDYNDICGVVLQSKGPEQLWIQIWNKNALDSEQVARFKISMNRLLSRTVAYQVHDHTLKMQARPQPVSAAAQVSSAPESKVDQAKVDDFVSDFLNTQ